MGALGDVWRPLGGRRGRFWRRLEGDLGRLGRSWRRLGDVLEFLGGALKASWGLLGGVLEIMLNQDEPRSDSDAKNAKTY